MNDLANYYRKLSAWEEKPVVELISPWERHDVEAIAADFRDAIPLCGFAADLLTIIAATSNQSIGNKVAEHLVNAINRHLTAFRIEDCSGSGYPDKVLRRLSNSRLFFFRVESDQRVQLQGLKSDRVDVVLAKAATIFY